MEPVAAHALDVELLGDRKAIGNVGMASVEGRIEAGNLQEVGLSLEYRADRRQVIGLVEGGERDEPLEPLEHSPADDGRLAIVGAAVDDAMTDCRRQLPADLPAQEGDDLVEGRRHVAHLRRGPRFIDERLPIDVLGHQVRPCADALDLSSEAPLELIIDRRPRTAET